MCWVLEELVFNTLVQEASDVGELVVVASCDLADLELFVDSLNGYSASFKILVLDIFYVPDVFQAVIKGRSGATDGAAKAGVSSPTTAPTCDAGVVICRYRRITGLNGVHILDSPAPSCQPP